MPNVYCRIPDAKAASSASRITANDDVWLRFLAAATDEIDQRCRRSFAARLVTEYLDGPRPCPENEAGTRLFLPFDVASITSLKAYTAAPLTYGTTLVANTDYLAVREEGDANRPYLYLDHLTSSWTEGLRTFQLVGLRGYSYELEATGQTVQNATEIAADGASLSVVDTKDIAVGEMLVIESEQVYVSAVQAAANTVTIVRAQNGTTAAAHANATVIYRRRYPRAIEQACALRAADLYRGAASGFAGTQGGDVAGFSSPSVYAQFMGLLGPYIWRGVR